MLNTLMYMGNSWGNDYGVNNHENNSFQPRHGTIAGFYHYLQDKYLHHLRLINELQDCLERDELNLCYQPLIDLETGRTTRVEALLRWQHKHSGSISPEIFIPLAEQTGQIHALTSWVLDHALQQLHAWISGGINIDIAVNLSMCNLHDENFPALVIGLLDKWSIPPELLILEITEGMIMYDPELTIRVLRKLNDLGARLALDDFGAGYSSLSHLAGLPITELKIDRTLIMDMDKNSKNALIVRSTIELARKLDMKITAEGVENAAVCNILKEYGCNSAQGYFFSKPVNDIEFTSWFSNSGRDPCN